MTERAERGWGLLLLVVWLIGLTATVGVALWFVSAVLWLDGMNGPTGSLLPAGKENWWVILLTPLCLLHRVKAVRDWMAFLLNKYV